MNDLRLALIQHEILPDNPEYNLDLFTQEMQGAHGCDLIILPEVFTTGFCANARNYAEQVGGRAYQWMADRAREFNAVVTGSIVVKEGDNYFNRLVWMRPDASFTHYDKRHLFRMAGEHTRYASGRERVLVELNGWRILPLICYDLRFPVWSRNRNDYDFTFYVANWPGARELHWNRLLQARAIENLSYVAGINRVGVDEKNQYYAGDTSLFGPSGVELLQAKDVRGCFTATLDANFLHQYRDSFPAYMDADDFDLYAR